MARFYTNIGAEHAAWLVQDHDGLADLIWHHADAALDLGGGHVALTDTALSRLAELRGGENFSLSDEDDGLYIWVAGNGSRLIPDRRLHNPKAAEVAGMSESAWRGTVSRDPEIQAEGRTIDGGHARPWWWESSILAWLAARPGRGARTDLTDKQIHRKDGDPTNNDPANLELRDTPTTEGTDT